MSSLRNFLHYSRILTSSSLGLQILVITLFSDTLAIRCNLAVRDQVLQPHKNRQNYSSILVTLHAASVGLEKHQQHKIVTDQYDRRCALYINFEVYVRNAATIRQRIFAYLVSIKAACADVARAPLSRAGKRANSTVAAVGQTLDAIVSILLVRKRNCRRRVAPRRNASTY